MRQVIPKFSKYEILGEIGHGGMGVVYKARHTSLGRFFAIKVILPNYTTDSQFAERFRLEARRAAKVNHQNIVQIVDEGTTEDGIPYMIMEYIEGTSLDKLIKETGPQDVDKTCSIIGQIAEALDYTHECGLVHRDIKSANILVTPRGRALLADFGIAHLVTDAHITRTGLVIGTPEFMSPEQILGKKDIDGRSDLFSLGIVLYNALSGILPFGGGTPIATGMSIVNDPPPPIKRHCEIPDWLESVIEGCLQKERERRIQTGNQLADLLRQKKKWKANGLRESGATQVIDTDKFESWGIRNKKPVGLGTKPSRKNIARSVMLGTLTLAIIAVVGFLFQNGKIHFPAGIFNKTKSLSAEQKTLKIAPAQISVPDVRGLTLNEAETRLNQLGLLVGNIDYLSSTTANIQKVVNQFPPHSTQVAIDTHINLTIGE